MILQVKNIRSLFSFAIVFTLAYSCQHVEKNDLVQIKYGTDTPSHGQVPLIKPDRFDSAINAIGNADSIGVYFCNGFENTEVTISEISFAKTSLRITTNPSSGIALFKILPKKHDSISLMINGVDYSLKLIKRYFLIIINYDKTKKVMQVEYTNDLPIFR